nr:DNA-directed RNA polymerase III subunit C3 [Cryptomonas paramecium]
MSSDIILDLAVEKIRIDFGNISATLFHVLIVQDGCDILEINKIIPSLEYKLIRYILFRLFNHDIVFFKKKNSKLNRRETNFMSLKFYPNVHTSILRIRFPRFLSIIEKEYGNTSRYIIKKFLEYGKINLVLLLKKIITFNLKKIQSVENCLINLIRDNFFKQITCSYTSHQSNLNKIQKPVCQIRSNYLWKICYSKMMLLMKLDLVTCVIDELFCCEIKMAIRCCFCRNIGNNSDNITSDCFSLDSLVDYTEEISDTMFKIELSFIQMIENCCIDQFILFIRNCTCKPNFNLVLDFLRKKLVENLIQNRFGYKFFKIFKFFFSSKLSNQIEFIEEYSIYKTITRKFFYQMYRLNFLFLEEKNKYKVFTNTNSSIMWKLNIVNLIDRFFFEISKTIYNLLVRKQELNFLFKKVKKIKNFQKKYNFFFYSNLLELNILRSDGLLIILEK